MNIIKRNFKASIALLLIGIIGIAEGQPNWQPLYLTLAATGLILIFIIWQNKKYL